MKTVTLRNSLTRYAGETPRATLQWRHPGEGRDPALVAVGRDKGHSVRFAPAKLDPGLRRGDATVESDATRGVEALPC